MGAQVQRLVLSDDVFAEFVLVVNLGDRIAVSGLHNGTLRSPEVVDWVLGRFLPITGLAVVHSSGFVASVGILGRWGG